MCSVLPLRLAAAHIVRSAIPADDDCGATSDHTAPPFRPTRRCAGCATAPARNGTRILLACSSRPWMTQAKQWRLRVFTKDASPPVVSDCPGPDARFGPVALLIGQSISGLGNAENAHLSIRSLRLTSDRKGVGWGRPPRCGCPLRRRSCGNSRTVAAIPSANGIGHRKEGK